jgi:hypothetical protein
MKEIFDFLEDLKESGQINMFGAAPVLQETFGLNKYEAREILADWMKSYE